MKLFIAAALVLFAAGAASAAEPRSIPLPPMAGVAGDFNQDGKPDILWQNAYTGALKVLLMNGITPMGFVPVNAATSNEGLSTAVATHDFDGDSKTDVAVWRGSHGGWYIVNSGTPFGAAAVRTDNWGLSTDIALPATYLP